jgi:hypothetical protein
MNFSKQIIILLALLAAGSSNTQASPTLTNTASTNRVLLIDASSMPVPGGKATLTIGELRRVDGVYTGDYKFKVFPYFLKNEKGRLAIVVSDASLAEVNQGKAAAVTGTATASGKSGKCRVIAATATPADMDHGTLKLWFMAGERKMIFEPAYHFVGNAPMAGLTPKVSTNLAPPQFLVVIQKP